MRCQQSRAHVRGGIQIKVKTFMSAQLCFFLSIAFGLIAWGIVTARYIWPELRFRPRAGALRPLLILHSSRFIGLAFLVPGVVSPDLPAAFDGRLQAGWSATPTLPLNAIALYV